MPETVRYEFIADTSQYDSNLKQSDKWTLKLDGSVERLGNTINATFSNKGLANSTKSYVVSLKSLNSELKKNITTSQSAQRQNAALLELRSRLAPSIKSEQIAIDKINTKLKENANLILKVSGAKRKATTTNTAFNQSLKKQSALLSQMGTQLGTVFSIIAAQRFIKQMVKVRGEFELQSVALTAMLQDKALADQMFQQVQDLALQSPFKILELNSYLKQLKAYRIENEDLVGTLKQLGDISAGLGVDMGRLILAYGQVKAASVLRGQELRQFTEAGIPLVAQLADKFTELEGEVVGTAEVFDRISKRQVSFEMIRDIFGDMTKEGGIFFDQQRLQAETLSGQVSVLADAYDKMLNALGKSNEGTLKGAIGIARSLVDNYKQVLVVLKALIVTYGTYRALLIANSIYELRRVNSLLRLSVVLKRNAAAQKLLNLTMLKNPYIAAAAAITGVIFGLYKLYKAREKVNQQAVVTQRLNLETAKRSKQETIGAKLLLEQLKATEKGSERRNALISEANSKYPDLLSNIDAETASITDLNTAYSSFIDTIEQGIRMDVILENIKETITGIQDLKDTLKTEEDELSAKKTQVVYTDFEKQKRANLKDELNAENEKLKILEKAALFQEDALRFGKEIAVVSEKIRDINKEVTDAQIALNATQVISSIISGDISYFKENNVELTEKEIKAQQELNEKIKEQQKLQAELAELLRIKDDSWENWRKDVNDIVESGSNTFDLKVKSEDVAYQDYIDGLRKSHAQLLKELKDINVENAKRQGDIALIEQYEKLNEELKTTEAIRRRLGFLWKEDNTGGRGAFDDQKANLKLLKEIRQTYLQIGSITKGTSLFEVDGDEFKDELEKIFKDPAYEKLLESYTDDDFRKYLEALLVEAKKSGSKTGKAWANALRSEIARIDKKNIFDFVGLQVEIEKSLNKFTEDFQPFGTGTELSITKIISQTLKAQKAASKELNDLEDLFAEAKTEKERKALEDQFGVGLKFAKKVTKQRIAGIEAAKQAQLDALSTAYIEEELKAESLLEIFKDINNATLRDLLKVKKVFKGIGDIEVNPEFNEALVKSGLTLESLNLLIDDLIAKNKEITQEKILEKVADVTQKAAASMIELGSAISALGDATEDADLEKLGNNIQLLGEISDKISGGVKAFVSGGPWALLAQGIADTIQIIASAIEESARHEVEFVESSKNFLKAVRKSKVEYDLWANDVVRSTRYVIDEFGNLKETTSAFDVDNPYSEAISGAEAYRDAIRKLTEEYNDLFHGDTLSSLGGRDSKSIEDRLNEIGKIQTGIKRDVGIFGQTKGEKKIYSSLADFLGVDEIDIFSKEQLNKALKSYDQLDDATKLLVDDWEAYNEAAEEALDQVNDSINELAGSLVGEFSDSLVDAFVNGANAADGMKESVEGIVEAMLQQMLTATLLAPVFDKLQQSMYRSLGLNPDGTVNQNAIAGQGGFDNDISDDIGRWFEETDLPGIIQQSNEWLQGVQDQFKDYGLDIFQPDAVDGLSRGIQSITEDTANIIAGYLNTIRHQVILNTGYLEQMLAGMQASQSIASQQLARLAQIEANTLRTADILEAAQNGSKVLNVA